MNSNISQMNFHEKKKAKEIDLKELFFVMKRRLYIIVIFTILAGAAGTYQSMKPVASLYQSTTRVIIGGQNQSMSTLQVILTDPTVLDIVVKKLKLNESSDALASQITVSNIDTSQVLGIDVVNSNPYQAAQIADTVAEVFKDEVPKILGHGDIKLLSKARVNLTPINPRSHKNMLYYTIFGLVAGIGLVFLLESLDDSVRSKRDIESIIGAPVLGTVLKMSNKNIKRKKNIRSNLEQRGEALGYE